MRALTISLNLHFYASYNAAPTQTVRGVGWHASVAPVLDLWAFVIMPEHVHENPVRRGLVECPRDWPFDCAQDWPWTSYRTWMGGKPEPPPLDLQSVPTSTTWLRACLRGRHGTHR